MKMSDAEVLAVAVSQMEPALDHRLSELLYRQQARMLTDNERAELTELMRVYQEGLLRKAKALNEAVKRGLRKPLSFQ